MLRFDWKNNVTISSIFTRNYSLEKLFHFSYNVADSSLKSWRGKPSVLKFDWRDKTPSGALSIQWFNEYLEDKDPKKLQRIIEYNEDDCKATMVIIDYLSGNNKTATQNTL